MDTTRRRVLRVGLVVDGVLRDQRLIPSGQAVTLGGSADHTVLAPLDAPVKLFDHRGGVPILRLTEAMRGRIGGTSGGVTFASLRKDPGVRRHDNAWLVPLSPVDRGKVDLGSGVVVLFQMAPPPPVPAVGALPQADFRPRLIEDDDPAYLGGLAAWAVMASVFAVVATHSTPPPTSLDSLPEAVRKQVFLPEDLVTVIEPQDEPQPEVPKPPEPSPEPEPDAVADAEVPADDERIEAMRAQRRQEEMVRDSELLAAMIRTRREGTGGAFDGADTFTERMDAMEDDFDKRDLVGDGEDRGPREYDGTTEDERVEVDGPTTGPTTLDRVETEIENIFQDPVKPPPTVDGDVIRQVIAANQGALTYCFTKQIKQVPDLRGRVQLAFEIIGGTPEAVYAEENTTGSQALEQCLVGKVRRWSFPGVDTEGELITVPLVFAPK